MSLARRVPEYGSLHQEFVELGEELRHLLFAADPAAPSLPLDGLGGSPRKRDAYPGPGQGGADRKFRDRLYHARRRMLRIEGDVRDLRQLIGEWLVPGSERRDPQPDRPKCGNVACSTFGKHQRFGAKFCDGCGRALA